MKSASRNHRFHLILPPVLHSDLRAFAAEHAMSVASAVRQLVGERLQARRQLATEEVTSLACLVAAEHAVLMVASILPEGEQRMRALAARATQSAEERLAALREQPAAPKEGSR